MKCIDAHIHFDLKQKDPAEDIVRNLQLMNCSAGVLILNSEAEKVFFLNNHSRLLNSGIGWHIGVLAGLQPCQADSQLYQLLDAENIPWSVKLHPRLSRFTLADIPSVLESVRCGKTNFQNIIIDGFYYGANLDNCIAMELVIASAGMFPEKRIVYAHSGGIHVLKTLVHLRELANVVYDFSLSCNYLCHTSVRQDFIQLLRYNKNKVMFGSDYPDFSLGSARAATLDIVRDAGLTSEEQDRIFFENAAAYYKFSSNGGYDR